MRGHCERIQGFFQSLASRSQYFLGLGIVSVTVEIQFVAARAEQRRARHLSHSANEFCREVGSRGRGETELTRRRFCTINSTPSE